MRHKVLATLAVASALSMGMGAAAELSVLKMNSGSLYRAIELVRVPVDVSENGLNVSVIGESGVLSTTRVLPVAVVLLLPPDELLPQAAIPRLRALAAARVARTLCFIA